MPVFTEISCTSCRRPVERDVATHCAACLRAYHPTCAPAKCAACSARGRLAGLPEVPGQGESRVPGTTTPAALWGVVLAGAFGVGLFVTAYPEEVGGWLRRMTDGRAGARPAASSTPRRVAQPKPPAPPVAPSRTQQRQREAAARARRARERALERGETEARVALERVLGGGEADLTWSAQGRPELEAALFALRAWEVVRPRAEEEGASGEPSRRPVPRWLELARGGASGRLAGAVLALADVAEAELVRDEDPERWQALSGEGTRRAPESGLAWYVRARACEACEAWAEAEEAWVRAEREVSRSTERNWVRSELRRRAGDEAMRGRDWERATVAYRETLEAWPARTEVELRLAEAFVRRGRPEYHLEARFVLDKLLQRAPDTALGRFWRGVALCDLGRWQDRARWLEEALEDLRRFEALAAAGAEGAERRVGGWVIQVRAYEALGDADGLRGALEGYLRWASPGHPFLPRAEALLEELEEERRAGGH